MNQVSCPHQSFGTTALAKCYVGWGIGLNVPARCWVFLVTSPLPLRLLQLLLSLLVIAAIILLVRRFRSHPALLPLLSGVNCLLVSFITFMALTIVSHLNQFIGAMGLPPYWPWFGR